MENLIERQRAKSISYRYRTGTVGPVVEVEVYYALGGANYFAGTQERRGIYLSVSPVKIGDGFVSYEGFSGIKVLVEELPKRSDKKLLAMAERVDPICKELAKVFEEGGKNAANRFMHEWRDNVSTGDEWFPSQQI